MIQIRGWRMLMKNKNLPLVVIFGRTNVGKSTLFNCLSEKRHALVSDIEGTTRDSNIGFVEWQKSAFKLVDTGGIMEIGFLKNPKLKTNDIDAQVQKQARNYLKQADLILFLVDTKAGILPDDKLIAEQLKKDKKIENKVILVANKADSPKIRLESVEFNKLNLNEPIPVSATTGSGTGDLLDIINSKLNQKPSFAKAMEGRPINKEEDEPIRVSIIGKPNVGKSSLVNSLIGEEKIIVSPIAHTTREPQDTLIKHKDSYINLIDTAGISKRGQKQARHTKKRETLEKFSITKSLRTLKKADIALLVLDINEKITHQESKLVEEIIKSKTSLIIIANKWDLIEEKNRKYWTREINIALPFCLWAPIHFTSALTGKSSKKILDIILDIARERKTEISPNALSKFLKTIIKKHAPQKAKGTKYPYIYELKQVEANPPVFSVRIGAKDTLLTSYLRFIENRLRDKFGFFGTPITTYIERNKSIHGKHEDRPDNIHETKKSGKDTQYTS